MTDEVFGASMPEQPRIERERVEWVFGLTGGELADEQWRHWYHSQYSDGTRREVTPPDPDPSNLHDGAFRYWYEGVPEYMEGARVMNTGVDTYRTAISWGGGFMSPPDEELYDEHGVWRLVATYNNSGETECPYRQGDHDGKDFRDAGTECDLCGEKCGDDHGHIYIGEGYEAVYKLDLALTYPEHKARVFVVLDIVVEAGATRPGLEDLAYATDSAYRALDEKEARYSSDRVSWYYDDCTTYYEAEELFGDLLKRRV